MAKLRLLIVYLYVFGTVNIVTSFVVPIFFGDVLLWHPRNLATDLMVGSVYLAMGIVMLPIARFPTRHKAFIDFLIFANVLHALVMFITAQKPSQIYLDAAYIGLAGAIPFALYPWPWSEFLRYRVSN
ncbi:hypothetical protein V3330_14545 [Wenzhouxiangellaceae bacterium CH-27]|uniref:Uncharacterized protein n=2 Tax=Elongatibacter sediminis TaxID=3119006 RepID=A0AAW9RKQ4_9GAMM